MIICIKCKVPQVEFRFTKDNSRENGLRAWCKICVAKSNAKNPQHYADHMMKKLRLKDEEY